MPLGSGRNIDVAWTEVTKLEDLPKVACNHCGVLISSKVERIKAHLAKCMQLVRMQRDNDGSDSDMPPGEAGVDQSDGRSEAQPQPGCSRDIKSHDFGEIKKKRKLQKSMDAYSVKKNRQLKRKYLTRKWLPSSMPTTYRSMLPTANSIWK